ncbi:MAG TPA: hypothetical protein VIN05_00885 [Roseovarius sp.]
MTEATGLPLLKAFKSDIFPLDRLDPGGDLVEVLSKILVTEYEQEQLSPGPGGRFEVGLTVEDEAVFDIVGLDGFAIVLGGAGATTLRFGVTYRPDGWEVMLGAGARLRFPRNVLKPVKREGDAWVDDPSRDYAELGISAGIIVDNNWDVDFDGSNAFTLEPAMIADSGLVIEGEVALDFSETRALPESAALGLPPSWKGVVFRSLILHLPDDVTEAVPVANLQFTNFHIGSGGVSGSIALNGTPSGGAIAGFPFRPTRLEVELVQNCLTSAEIEGQLTLSFFDEALDVVAGFDLDGNFTVSVAADSGLVTLNKPGLLDLSVDGIRFAREDDVFLVGISGTLTPLIGGLDWPGFTIQELSVDSRGNVKLDGGWLNLPDQYTLDFHGFFVSITQLGMGSTEDGGKWIGFSGSIKLVDGLSIGGSVDGLKLTWYDDGRDPKLTLSGVGVELEIPEVLRFKGSVSYNELPGPQHRFDGDITLELLALDLRIDGKIVIGTDTDAGGQTYTFFALYIGVELPAGIPLWATGLGLYGVAGLIAINMAPNKGAAPNPLHPASRTDEEWYENFDGSDGWYKRPTRGVTDLRSKWDPEPGGFALGGGVTIGTLPDNGFTFNGSLLLVISFPGPVILLEGKANMLKQRSALSDDPLFRALVVLDFRAGEMLFGLDAKYKVGDGGELIEIGGSAEAFFDFNDANRWHLYLGRKDPRERRLRAQILSLFESNSYFMIDPQMLQTGAWTGYDKRWSFGPLSVTIEAWIEGGVAVSWKPVYFHGEIWLHGKVELKVFGFGLGLHADARFSCDVFDPFHVKAELSVGINLPWPLPDFDVDITLEWGPTPDQPPLPMPLKEIAVEHFKSTASWPLPQGDLMLPVVADAEGFLTEPVPAANLGAPPPANAPVVPMDARPRITFGRTVHDDALVGTNAQPAWPGAVPPGYERIGDPEQNEGPMRVRYAVKEVVLARWDGSAWRTEARKPAIPAEPDAKALFGSWAPMPQLPSGSVLPGSDPPVSNSKLWLWSKSPFDHSVHGGSAWDEWFTDVFDQYPCIPPVPERTICCDFDDIPEGTQLTLPMTCYEHSEIVYVGRLEGQVTALPAEIDGHRHAFCWSAPPKVPSTTVPVQGGSFGIVLSGPAARRMTLLFAQRDPVVRRLCFTVGRETGTLLQFPLTVNKTTVRIFDRTGRAIGQRTLGVFDSNRFGFDMGWKAEVELPCATARVSVTLIQSASPVKIAGLDADGSVVAVTEGPDQQGVVTVLLQGADIVRIVIDAPQDETTLIEICTDCVASGEPGVSVTAIDDGGGTFGPFLPSGGLVTVPVPDLRAVRIDVRERACLIRVCVTYPPDAAAVAAAQEMQQNLLDSMALWGDEGEVLHPDSDYRIVVATEVDAIGEGALNGVTKTLNVTQAGYFRTQGPPGLTALSSPVNHPPEEPFDSGLEDLTRYVRQTVPPTVPVPGQQPLRPRPVYRAYDVGVAFNEDYVDLMYRLAHRDLSLYLYDANNELVRDAEGRLIVAPNLWGRTADILLSESTIRYLSVIDAATCVATDPEIIPHQKTLFSVDMGQVLEPDAAYEARLVPLLLHEDFRDGLGDWTIVDSGGNQTPSGWDTLGHPALEGTGTVAAGPVVTLAGAGDLSALDPATDSVILATDTARQSKTYRIIAVDNVAKTLTLDGNPVLSSGTSAWEVPGWGAVVQTSNIWGGSTAAASAAKPGTMLIGGDPGWTDYRLSVLMRSADDDAFGVVLRYSGAGDFYRFSMDRERGYRRLVRFSGGAATTLAEDDFVYQSDSDYLITIEALGEDLRVYQDGAPVFDVTDGTHGGGRVGFYCWANQGARFADLRVDDLSITAPVVYRFPFVTSDYADVYHHLHSFDDRLWATDAQDGALAAEIGAAVAPGSVVTEDETRAFDAFEAKVLGAAAQTEPERVEVHRIAANGGDIGLLLRSPEPLDWSRTSFSVERAARDLRVPAAPGDLKVTELTVGGDDANDESVTVLARRRQSLAGHVIETYGIPGPLRDAAPDLLLEDDFDRDGGVLFEEGFDAGALDTYRIVDAGLAISGPSQWAVTGGEIVQTANIHSGPSFGTTVARHGTMALTGLPRRNIRLTVGMTSTDDDAIGAVFRVEDDRNYYRFSMDRERSYRRLVKVVDGTATVLWQDNAIYDTNRRYELRIDAVDDVLAGYLDNHPLFRVVDDSIRAGQVGLYCWANIGARFDTLRVEALETDPLLFQPPLEDAGELEVLDTGTFSAPSAWDAVAGVVSQTSNIWGGTWGGIEAPGTMALLAPGFADLDLSVTITSADDDAVGVVFRHVDPDTWYRFSMSRQHGYRRLVASVGGAVTVLWQDATPYVMGQANAVTIRAEGRRLRGWMNGAPLFDLTDAAIAGGRVGFYSCGNAGVTFAAVSVCDPVRRVGAWRLVDEIASPAPSRWRAGGGSLRQTAALGGPVAGARGALALAGQTSWDDVRMTVRGRSDAPDAIGVVFRYRDPDNWYRLALDAQRGFRRLVRCLGGVQSVLWEDAHPPATGASFALRIDAVGDRLSAEMGGLPLFRLTDASHATGAVGLYAWQNPGARFERVEVTRPPLDAYALFRDRFAAGDMSAWSFVDQGTQSAPSAWSIVAGELRQTSNIHSLPVDPADVPKPGAFAVAGNVAWGDVVWTADLQAGDDDAIGVMFRVAGPNDYYRFSMDRERTYRRLVRCEAGVFTTLWQDGGSYETGRRYSFTIASIGARHTIWLDGIPLVEVEDATHAAGRIGLYVWAHTDARFSNVRVFGPGRLATADLLDEDFAQASTEPWSVVTAGTQLGPAVWDVANGELRQTSNVWGGIDNFAELGKPGSIALYTRELSLDDAGLVGGSADWSDYRVTVRLRSGDDDAIGVVVRYRDADNWYRFSMDRQRGYRRLVRSVNGTVTELWGDTQAYTLGRDYLLTLDAIGDTLVGYLDGAVLFSVSDDSHETGTVGLYVWANTGAVFHSVRVTAADWITHHRFASDEPRRAAGTRVVVHSGNAMDWTAPPVPGVARHFIAKAPDPGRRRLPSMRALDVRLRDAKRETVHARRFLENGAYAAMGGATVLRNADGTGLAIFAGAPLPEGSYRLRLVYRRDNTAAKPDSLVLSRAGDTSDEVVWLDVPWPET